MRQLVARAGLADHIEVESAGTGGWHVGDPADPRSRATARKRGVELDGCARQFVAADFARLDFVVALDKKNLAALGTLAAGRREHLAKLSLLRSYDAASPRDADVPDPYYGGERGFDQVFDLCEAACRGLLAHIRKTHGLP